MILVVPIYGCEQTGARTEARQRGAADPGAARRAPAPRLRDRPADRQPLRRRHQLPRDVALSHSVPARGPRLDRGPVGRARRAAPPPVLQAHAHRTADPRQPARRVGHVLHRAESRGEDPDSVILPPKGGSYRNNEQKLRNKRREPPAAKNPVASAFRRKRQRRSNDMDWKTQIRSARGPASDEGVLEELAQHAAATYAAARAEDCDATQAEDRVAQQIQAWAADPLILRRRPKRVPAIEPPAGSASPLAAIGQDTRYAWRLL